MSISVNTEMIFDKKTTPFYELDDTVRRPEKGPLRNTQLLLLFSAGAETEPGVFLLSLLPGGFR